MAISSDDMDGTGSAMDPLPRAMVSPFITHGRRQFALAYAWAGVAMMWAIWVSFVIFLAEPRRVLRWWPLPTVDGVGSAADPILAALTDLALVTLFGLQHSVMARPWFKRQAMSWIPDGLERSTYLHMANLAMCR